MSDDRFDAVISKLREGRPRLESDHPAARVVARAILRDFVEDVERATIATMQDSLHEFAQHLREAADDFDKIAEEAAK